MNNDVKALWGGGPEGIGLVDVEYTGKMIDLVLEYYGSKALNFLPGGFQGGRVRVRDYDLTVPRDPSGPSGNRKATFTTRSRPAPE